MDRNSPCRRGSPAPTFVALLVALAASGCQDEEPSAPENITWGDEVVCSDPSDGIGDYLDAAEYRGLDRPAPPTPDDRGCIPIVGHVLSEDLDDDGDYDLVLYEPEGLPRVHRNDGPRFTEMPRSTDSPVPGRVVLGMGLVDLDEDRFPDLVLTGEGFVGTMRGTGRNSFEDFELLLLEEDYPRGCYHSVAAGDVDGDGRADLYIPGLDRLDDADAMWQPAPIEGATDLLFLRTDSGFEPAHDRLIADETAAVLLGLFTDRDGDGDADLLVPPDRPYINEIPIAFHEAHGGVLTDDAAERSIDLLVSGMGAASADFNQDGLLDYCITDAAATIPCMQSDLSSGELRYVEVGLVLGMWIDAEPMDEFDETVWEGWAIEIMDLDNDGDLDAVSPAGLPQFGAWPRRDGLWEGSGGAFREVGLEVGFDPDQGNHYGLAAADFDGDGGRDLVIGSRSGPPIFYERGCTSGGWLEVELVGPVGNPRGLGAMVTAEHATRTDLHEIYGPRGWGQSPAAAHIGLGAQETLPRLSVRWPDGRVDEVTEVPRNRKVVVRHPDAP